MKRRHILLAGIGAVGALSIGWSLLPPRQRLQPSAPLTTSKGQVALNGWVKISVDGRVSVVVPKSEMGQGVHTGLAMVLADELDADWSTVGIEQAPVDAIYNNIATTVDALPFHPDDDGAMRHAFEWLTAKGMREFGLMMTGGSSSLKDLWLPMREAGASARALIVQAAASKWSLPTTGIMVQDGVVSHPSGRSARFGELAAAAGALPLPPAPRLKDPAEFRLIGRPLHRIEAAAKGNGSARFGIDVVVPDMLYASVVMSPVLGGRVAQHDGSAATKLPGVRKALTFDAGAWGGSGGVAVVADTPWQALQAVRQVKVQWDDGPAAEWSDAQVIQRLSGALGGSDNFIYLDRGNAEGALMGAARRLKADYSAPYLGHAAMEPVNCTVQVGDDKVTVWASTQVPDVARAVVARLLGRPEDKVDMQVQLIGGGFGRRLDVDFIAQAALIAREMPGRAVQTIWSREQDMTHDFYRPACVARFEAGLDASGRLVAWTNRSASQAIVPQVMSRYAAGVRAVPMLAQGQLLMGRISQPLGYVPGMGLDKTAAEGAFDQAYEFAAASVGHTLVDLPLPVGFWRSVGHSHQAFFQESFIDEVAHAVAQDAVAFRASLLQRHPRHLAVLKRVAELAGWGLPLEAASDGARKARGVALHQSFGSIVGQVAEVSLDRQGAPRVHRVFCVIDCGTPVNPNLIRQQMESAVVFGLSAALSGRITLDKGRVQQTNFHDVPLLRMADCPVVVTEIMPSTAHPEGVGEPGTPPVAPAVANALFVLTGQRLRTLPLRLSAPPAA